MPASEVRRPAVLSLSQLSGLSCVSGDCSDVYSQDSDNCDSGCGVCFNGQGRSSTAEFDVVTCPASGSPGYYCNPEGGVFACMDWTAGSNKLEEQQDKFAQRT